MIGKAAPALAGLVSVWVVGAALAQDKPLHGIYTCVDDRGRTLTSDRPIPQCMDREQRVLGPSGTVRGVLRPGPTPQERAQQEAREREEARQRAQARQRRIKERALLHRYPDPQAHDEERDEQLAQIEMLKRAAEQRKKTLMKERERLNEELEFFNKDLAKAPPLLQQHFKDNEASTRAQDDFIALQDQEAQKIRARFDAEHEQLKPLWDAAAR